MNAGRDEVAMGVDGAGGEKQKIAHSIYVQSDERHAIYWRKGERTDEL